MIPAGTGRRSRAAIGLRPLAPRATLPRRRSVRNAMPQLEFELDREYVELNQLLKLVGLCYSGGAGKALVASGAVTVDGAIELRKTCKIRAGQQVRIGDFEVRVRRPPQDPG
jgi:ribosome-associated protein